MNLFVFDLFQARILIGAYIILFAILPTFLGIYFLYQAVTTFFLSTLSDKQYTRWFATVLGSFLAAVVLLGGVVDRTNNATQVQNLVFYSIDAHPNAGAKVFTKSKLIVPDDIEAVLSMPYENFAYLSSPFEVLSDDPQNLAEPTIAGWIKGVKQVKDLPEIISTKVAGTQTLPAHRIKSSIDLGEFKAGGTLPNISAAGVNQNDVELQQALHQLHGMVDSLNARMVDFPVLSGMVAYMTNTFSSLMYTAIAISVSRATAEVDNFIRIKIDPSKPSLWEDGVRYALNYKFNETYAGDGPAPVTYELYERPRDNILNQFLGLFRRQSLFAALLTASPENSTGNTPSADYRYSLALMDSSMYRQVCMTSSEAFNSPSAGLSPVSFLNQCNMSGGEYTTPKELFDKVVTDLASSYKNFVFGSIDDKWTIEDAIKKISESTSMTLKFTENTCSDETSWTALRGTYNSPPDPFAEESTAIRRTDRPCAALQSGIITNMEKLQEQVLENEEKYNSRYIARRTEVVGYVSPLDESFASTSYNTDNLAGGGPPTQTTIATANGGQVVANFTDLGKALADVIGAMGRLGGANEIPITPSPVTASKYKEKIQNAGILDLLKDPAFQKLGLAGVNMYASSKGGWWNLLAGATLPAMLEVMLKLAVASAVSTAYCMAYYGIIISTSLGLALFPIWIAFALGKIIFHGAVGDTRGGITVFPIMEFIGFPLLIGAELCMLGIIHGAAVEFVAAKQNAAIGAVISTMQGLTGTMGNVVESSLSLSTFLGAVSCLGILVGLGIIPVEIAKLLRKEVYGTDTVMTKQKMQEAMSATAVDDQKMQSVSYGATSMGRSLGIFGKNKAAAPMQAQTAKTPAAKTPAAKTPAAQKTKE